jgi:hypothetical protein
MWAIAPAMVGGDPACRGKFPVGGDPVLVNGNCGSCVGGGRGPL